MSLRYVPFRYRRPPETELLPQRQVSAIATYWNKTTMTTRLPPNRQSPPEATARHAMNMKILLGATIGSGVLAWGHASAQESLKGAVLVFAKGACTHFVVSGQSYPCTTVIYTHFKNGRTAWQVPMPHGALMLAGGQDSQLDPTKYVLQIDRLRAGRSDGSSQPYPAQGKCIAKLSPDGRYLHSLSCSATNGIEGVELEFQGDGSPVDRKIL